MPSFYADSSVLVKRHVTELGSAWVRNIFTALQPGEVISSLLCVVEGVSAFNRRLREGTLTATDYQLLRNDFVTLCRTDYSLVRISDALLLQTQALLEHHPLRAYDALHLASALAANASLLAAGQTSLTFLAADKRLLAAAGAEGLAVDNPESYP
jgi:uncharacterized protein